MIISRVILVRVIADQVCQEPAVNAFVVMHHPVRDVVKPQKGRKCSYSGRPAKPYHVRHVQHSLTQAGEIFRHTGSTVRSRRSFGRCLRAIRLCFWCRAGFCLAGPGFLSFFTHNKTLKGIRGRKPGTITTTFILTLLVLYFIYFILTGFRDNRKLFEKLFIRL